MDTINSTLSFYDDNAEQYAAKKSDVTFEDYRTTFASKLAPGSRILELGCGGGYDALALLELGFDVTPLDGSPELAAIAARRTKHEVLVMDFEDLDFDGEYDGVWAAASLLHVPSDKITPVLKRVARSLRKGGVLVASFKQSEVDWADDFGRYFCAMTRQDLTEMLAASGFELNKIDAVPGQGSDGNPTTWLWATAHRT